MAAPPRIVKAACGGGAILARSPVMTNPKDDREARLAQALRDNLRPRKAQAREGQSEDAPKKSGER